MDGRHRTGANSGAGAIDAVGERTSVDGLRWGANCSMALEDASDMSSDVCSRLIVCVGGEFGSTKLMTSEDFTAEESGAMTNEGTYTLRGVRARLRRPGLRGGGTAGTFALGRMNGLIDKRLRCDGGSRKGSG